MAKKKEPWFWTGYMWGMQPIHWKGVVWILFCVALMLGTQPLFTWLEAFGLANADGYSFVAFIGIFIVFWIVCLIKTDRTTKWH